MGLPFGAPCSACRWSWRELASIDEVAGQWLLRGESCHFSYLSSSHTRLCCWLVQGIASRLGVSSLPAFFAFRDMKLVGRCRGAQVDVLWKMLVDNTVQGEAGYVLPCFRKRKAQVRGGGPRSASSLR